MGFQKKSSVDGKLGGHHTKQIKNRKLGHVYVDNAFISKLYKTAQN